MHSFFFIAIVSGIHSSIIFVDMKDIDFYKLIFSLAFWFWKLCVC